jgi:hypothetical protein
MTTEKTNDCHFKFRFMLKYTYFNQPIKVNPYLFCSSVFETLTQSIKAVKKIDLIYRLINA